MPHLQIRTYTHLISLVQRAGSMPRAFEHFAD
jgi:hypothetical protein